MLEVLAAGGDGREAAPAVPAERVEHLHRVVRLHYGDSEHRSARRSHHLRGVRVHRIAAEQYSRRPGGLSAAQQRARVARVTHRHRHEHEPVRAHVVEVGSGHRRHGEHRLRGHGVADPLEHAVLQLLDRDVEVPEPRDQRCEGPIGAGPDVRALELGAAIECRGQHARSLDDEGVFRAAGARVANEIAEPPNSMVPRTERRHGLLRPLAAPRERLRPARRTQPGRAPRGRRGSCGRRRCRRPSARPRSASTRPRAAGTRR